MITTRALCQWSTVGAARSAANHATPHQPFDGPVLGWTWGVAVAGGVSFRYDKDGRIAALGDGGTISDEHDYVYDPASLLRSTTVPALQCINKQLHGLFR